VSRTSLFRDEVQQRSSIPDKTKIGSRGRQDVEHVDPGLDKRKIKKI